MFLKENYKNQTGQVRYLKFQGRGFFNKMYLKKIDKVHKKDIMTAIEAKHRFDRLFNNLKSKNNALVTQSGFREPAERGYALVRIQPSAQKL